MTIVIACNDNGYRQRSCLHIQKPNCFNVQQVLNGKIDLLQLLRIRILNFKN